MNYVNDGLPFLVNSRIVEYDMAKGNTSVMREYHLLKDEDIDTLESLPKEDRVRRVGILQKNNRFLAQSLESCFDKAVQSFMDENELDIDVDVLCIRRDAVFVVNKPIRNEVIGTHLHFRPKKIYHASLQIGPKLHFLFEEDGPLHVDHFIREEKDYDGILAKLHLGILDFIEEFVSTCEGCNMNREIVYQYIHNFCTLYKEKRLDWEYYREFTREALFHLSLNGEVHYVDYLTEDLEPYLDISHNYRAIIIPLLQILI